MKSKIALSLHHVGYAVRDIEAMAAKYVARLGYEVSTPVIHDPLQTAHVQFLKLARDAAYLEFVSPDSGESALAEAVKRGGGLNHVCYTAGLLEETIAHLEENGMRLISEPKPGVAFGGRRICWLLGERERVPIELVERRDDADLCEPGH